MVASFHPSSPATSGCTSCSSELALTASVTVRAVVEGDLMSGHSKWATIKHKKGAADKAAASSSPS